MKEKLNKIAFSLIMLTFCIFSTSIIFDTERLYASENAESVLIKKVSESYTKKFCNSIGFGLSKESAMNFSLNENNKVFNKRKEFNSINKELLADKIAISVIEKCGYPINLSGEKGILEFKTYYLSKDQESTVTK
ncbi:Hypothetical protein NATL1_16711 [Prochlorococcus marinus str. NATL1A]|uniref:Uncharacterized protein n=1 Tax=Prochlorococcus marinus (strain NATL1A) TaxID=167555 RepID=A2C418_PROM1|nr:hypothetical protein [Prochlorococcus marinus]ABM76228.1 Hypothetical protein NATL1_16711 [Prochlorococcus marinus str. NATL1A]